MAEHGRLDVLVNNAGGAPYARAADASPRFHDKIVGLNLLSPLLCRPGRQRGDAGPGRAAASIVNISSISRRPRLAGHAAYARGQGRASTR